MNIYDQKRAAAGIGRIMSSKWAPVLAPPNEGGGGEGEGEGDEDGDGDGDGDGGEGDGGDTDDKTKNKDGDKSKKKDGEGGEGGNKPTDNEARLIKDIGKAKERQKIAERDLAEAKAKLKEFEGVDPAKAREAQAAARKAEEDKLKASGDFDRLKEMMANEHKSELETVRAAEKTANDRLAEAQGRIADLTVGNAFSSSTYVAENLILTPNKARVQFGSHFEYEDGEVVGYDKPAGKKDRTKLVDGSGNALSFEKALKKIVDADDEKDTLLKSKLKDGAGSNTSNNNKGSGKEDSKELRGVSRLAAALREQNKKG